MTTYLWLARLAFIAGVFFCSQTSALADNNIVAKTILLPANFSINNNIDAIQTLPPTFNLIKLQPNSRTGLIWVGQSVQGLFIVGKIFGAPPKWPQTLAALIDSDYIELWLASVDQINLPPVGWGNQFGNETLTSASDCKHYKNVSTHDFINECPQWFNKQIAYRQSFNKLFIRQWQLAPTLVNETYATPAYNELSTLTNNQLTPLKPGANPQIIVRPATHKNYAYDFTIFIPWNALPPAQQLSLDHLRLLVNIFNPGANQPTASKNIPINPASFNLIQLSKPQHYFITACQYDLQNLLINANNNATDFIAASHQAKAYFMPGDKLDIRSVLIVDNNAKGYQYVPNMHTYSPLVYTEDFFMRPLTTATKPTHLVCGPPLAVSSNGNITRANAVVNNTITVHNLPDGDWLIQDGPRVVYYYFGTGQCGACPRVKLSMYVIDQKTNAIKSAFDYITIVDPLYEDVDIHITPDGKSITLYKGKVDAEKETTLWQAETYCYQALANSYQLCQKIMRSTEPTPRFLEPNKVN